MQAKSTRKATVAFALLATILCMLSSCQKDIPKKDALYDLDVNLYGGGKNISADGFIKFRQDPDTARIIDLETWVSKLQSDHSYLLQRAVNPIADSTGCSSTAWLTLGNLLVPEAIHTDGHGNGHANLSRAVTAIARGTAFHIHFQVVDSATLAPVLSSGCFDFTVR